MFSKHHYLNTKIHKAARVFLLFANDHLAGFCGVMHFPHSTSKKVKRVHRIVILPDFQGVGLGAFLLSFVANHYKNNGFKFFLTTANPALLHFFQSSGEWRLKRVGRSQSSGKNSARADMIKNLRRKTTSWEYIG